MKNRAVAFLRQNVLPAVVCFAGAWALAQTTLLRRIENVTSDERTRLRAKFEVTVAPDEIALVAIDETSLREAGRWPWDRDVHGHLLELLSRVRPAVVTWDILFTEPSPKDGYFARAIAANRAVVLGAMRVADVEDGVLPADAAAAGTRLQPLLRVAGDKSRILAAPAIVAPAGQLGAVSSIGFVDTPPGDDGVRRSAPLVVRVGDQVFPTLSLRTAMEYWSARPQDVMVRLGDAVYIDAPLAKRRIPIDETGAFTVNYRHGSDGFVQRGYTSVLEELSRRYEKHEPVGLCGLTGRMLLVGQVADGLSDFGETPLSPLTPLVLVHANILENILREDYVRPVPEIWIWLGAVVVGVAGLARFSRRSALEQAVFAIGVPAAFAIAAVLLWFNASWVVPVVGPVLGFAALQVFMIARRMLAEQRAKEQIKGMFGTYVSPELVNRLVASGKQPELGGHEEDVTAFFSDIQEFSTFSEILPPDRLVEMMNEYLTACTDIVQGEGGTLDKYIGDAIVAMFGAPVPMPDHAHRACVVVVRMQDQLEELRAKWRRDGKWPELVTRTRARIGLNSGNCVIGNMGSRTRFNYTMMGDNVNLAARMESGAKSWGTYAMCTEATKVACEQHAPGEILFRPLGRIQVKGRANAVPIFEIAGFRATTSAQVHDCLEVFSRALEHYYDRDWDAAAKLFERSATLESLVPGRSPGVKLNPSLVYLSLISQLRSDPPADDWDGVFVMKEK